MDNNNNPGKDPKTNEDFTGHPHYPANDDMLKKDSKEAYNADEKSFTKDAEAQREEDLPYDQGDVLRGEMDQESDQLPGKKSNNKDEGDV